MENIQYNDFFFELIIDNKVEVQYFEEEQEPKLSFSMDDETDQYFKDNPDVFDAFIEYIQKSLVIAHYAGFEAPSDFYTAIKAYVESEGDGVL